MVASDVVNYLISEKEERGWLLGIGKEGEGEERKKGGVREARKKKGAVGGSGTWVSVQKNNNTNGEEKGGPLVKNE